MADTATVSLASDRAGWWRAARFGMFIHWGLYAIPARGEWVMHAERVRIGEYEKMAKVFNPVKYDPRSWARLARRAGMRYMVLTTKHHDGFCLFDTKTTRFNAVRSAARRDLVREYAVACRAEGLGVGFYFSIKDWHHPACPLDAQDRLRNFEPEIRRPDPVKFLAYAKAQITELLSNYGKVDIIWFDGRLEAMKPFGPQLAAYIRSLQPGILINNRLGQDEDFKTPEQEIPSRPLTGADGRLLNWEACDTLTGGSWGYCPCDRHILRPPENLIRRLVRSAASGGNYLLNVGPRADGAIPSEAVAQLEAIGKWMRCHGEAVYGTEAGPASDPRCGRMTRRGNKIYLHVFEWPAGGRMALPPLSGRLLSARIMNGAELAINRSFLAVPRKAPDKAASVVVLDYSIPPVFNPPRIIKGRRPGSKPLPVGYRVVRGRPAALCDRGQLAGGEERADEDFWRGIRPIRFTPEGHFDHALERFAGVPRDNAFACTLRAMHAGEVLYLKLDVETDRVYTRPDFDIVQDDGAKFFFAAGRNCTRNQYNPEAFELTVQASGRTWMPNEALFPEKVFRHEAFLTPAGYTIMLAVPFRMMLKNIKDPDSHLRAGDTLRFNLLAVQAAPFARPWKVRLPKNKKPEWWQRPVDPRAIFTGCRHWLFWKGQREDDPFDNVTVWDVWKIEK